MILADFFAGLRRGEPPYAIRWETYLGHLALALNNLHMVLDCTIVLGGISRLI